MEKNVDTLKIDVTDNEKNNLLEKFKKIGKIGEDKTILDKESSNEDLDLKSDKLKIHAQGSFTSVRANNCVFKGKWCYEVVLLSNKLCQIGWCQIQTPFKTKDGVGDDPTSYAYDGFRVLKWGGGVSVKQMYGKNWDIGDIIGVCIDLDNKNIEYFMNGNPLGVAFTNIPTGANHAYFPAITLSKNEKVLFNFGDTEMFYKYTGYEQFDIKQSIYKCSLEVTINLIDIVKSFILKLFNIQDLEKMFKFATSSQIFNFIANISFKDLHIFSTIIIPFLIEISESEIDFLNFFKNIYIYTENKIEFTNNLFEKLSNLIELNSARGVEGLKERGKVLNVFNKLLNIDFIIQLWVEGRKYIDHFKNIISANFLKINDILYFILEKKNKKEDNIRSTEHKFKNTKLFYFEIRLQCEEELLKAMEMTSYEEAINTSFTDLFKRFIEDKRTFKVNNKNYTMRSILVEYYTKHIKDNSYQGSEIVDYLHGYPNFCPNENFIKYYYFNMLEIFSQYFGNDLSNFSIEPWFNRLKSDSLYRDEVGVGGTITHVTSEYGEKIDSKYREKQDNLLNYLFHRLLNLTTTYIVPFLISLCKLIDEIDEFRITLEEEAKRGSYIHFYYRTYLNIFTERNQILIYQLSYFIINWLNSLIKANKQILYFIPKSIMQLPYEIFKFLIQSKSSIVFKENLIQEANSKSIYFKDNNYIYQILYFYCYMFHDSNIANPDLKEGFITKISYFLKKKRFVKSFEDNEELLEMLIRGLLLNMTNESMSQPASENIVKIIKPSCFGELVENNSKGTLMKVIKKFFETNVEIFHEFMNNYYNLLNKIMTEYTLYMTEAGSTRNRNGVDQYEYTSIYTKKMSFSYCFLCDLMKILEFFLAAYPNEFLDITSLNFSRFSNFLKNLSSRILDSTYVEKFLNLIERSKPGQSIELFRQIAYSTIGIMLNIYSNKNFKNYNEFIQKLVSQTVFDVEPFYNVIKYTKINHLIKTGVEKYKEIIDSFSCIRSSKAEKKMTESEWEETVKKEYICIICYVNESDRIMIPCKHGNIFFNILVCCNECLVQYLIDKQYCFICNSNIEKTEINK